MARLSLITLGVLSLLVLSTSVGGDDPSYKECQPHIDATIRNLAAKAVHAGEVPSEEEAKEFATPFEHDDDDHEDEAPSVKEETPPPPPPVVAPVQEEQETQLIDEEEEKEEEEEVVEEGKEEEKTEEEPIKDSPPQPKEPEQESKKKEEGIAKIRQGKDKHAKEAEEKKAKEAEAEEIEPEESKSKERVSKEEKHKRKESTTKLGHQKHKPQDHHAAKKGDKERPPPKTQKEFKKQEHKKQEDKEKKEPTKEKLDDKHSKGRPISKADEAKTKAEDAKRKDKFKKETQERERHDKQKHERPKTLEKERRKPEGVKQKEEPPRPSKPKTPEPKPEEKQKLDEKAKLGLFSKFIDMVFGMPKGPRDPKYATPWNTHPEFKKKETTEEEKKPVSKEYKPGIIGRTMNSMVDLIFGLPKTTRDPKYAEPWQTHKEFKKEEAPAKEEKTKKQEPSRLKFVATFFNAVVEKIFGKVTTTRDPKYAEPWQTHKEHVKEPKKPVETKKVVPKPGGGITNYLVSLIFEIPKGQRDPKWAEPWQTHKEHIKEEKAPQEKAPKAIPKSSVFSDMINKVVYSIFGKVDQVRDEKWKEPWQKHPEFQKEQKEAPEKKKPTQTGPGIIGRALNSFVESIFGKTITTRDPKWAEPWQTHAATKAEATKAPTPSTTPSEKRPAPPKEEPRKAAPPPPPPPVRERSPPPPPVRERSPSPEPASHPPPPPPPSKVKKPVEEVKEAPKVKPETPPPAPKKEEKKEPEPKETFPSDTPSPSSKPPKKEPPPPPVADAPKAPQKQVLEETFKEKKSKIDEDDDEQIVLVPSAFRSRDHINSILGLDDISRLAAQRTEPIAEATLKDLKGIYDSAVKPLENIYKYQDISNRHLSDAEIFGRPLILLLGPYSTGKSTFLNYLLGIEFTKRALKTGTPPSHGVFRTIQYGSQDRELDGTDLSGQGSFMTLQKFGQNFVDQIYGKALNIPLLKKVTFVEAPGILEMRRPGERLYPFNDAIQWFIDRADLILVMFDYTKLDAGYEMEAVLDQLKGREAQTRILLNKADQVPPEELIKVQGSLFWNLSPLLGVSAPPTVYAGSFASRPYRTSSPVKLFQAQEEALLHDIAKAINSRVDNRIAITRRHAVRVRNHAQMVDSYLSTFYRNKGFLTSKHKLAEDIVNNPHAYNIYEGMSLLTNISRYDLPDSDVYRDFFRIHNLYEFRTLRETCTYIGGCPLEKIDAAISEKLPELMVKYKRLVEAAASGSPLPDPKKVNQPNYDERMAHVHTRTL